MNVDVDIKMPFKNSSITELLKLYDAFLIDVWGVIHDGVNPYAGVVDCLNHMISQGKHILFLSNAPRPGNILIQKIAQFGIHANLEMMLSSGDVTRYQLTHFEDPFFQGKGRCFYHLGAERNQDILAGLTLNLSNHLEEADIILMTAYIDEGEDLDQYDVFLEKALKLNKPIICANPDKEVINGDKIRFCAGFLAEKYEKMGGVVHYYGKPYPEIYRMALKRLQKTGNKDLELKNILAIGDTLETDIAGAQNMGIDSALVSTGNMERHLNAGLKSDYFKQHTPTWMIPSLSLN